MDTLIQHTRFSACGLMILLWTPWSNTHDSLPVVLWYSYGHPDQTHTILCLWSYDTLMDTPIKHTRFSACGLMILLWTSWSNTHDSLSVVLWYCYGHPDPTHAILCLWSYDTVMDILIQHTRFSVCSLIILWTSWSNTHHSLSAVLWYYYGRPDPTHTILCLQSYNIMNILIQQTRFFAFL